MTSKIMVLVGAREGLRDWASEVIFGSQACGGRQSIMAVGLGDAETKRQGTAALHNLAGFQLRKAGMGK